ncbi:hypothetical protein RUM44_010038 [Polyplax serrata]|uniref:WASH complex subunit 7 n=1 Tax=Polyplax serrata TaxID=468196 RepID=A0ABR1AUG6_POLSC
MVTEEWSHEEVASRTNKIVVEVLLRKYGRFIDNYSNKLKYLEDSFTTGFKTLSHNPINVKLNGRERVDVLNLVNTDNKILNKIVVVLATLCLEVRERKDEAHSKYYNGLLRFGEECDNGDQRKSHITISKYLPLFQELHCFINRCHQIVIKLVKQLAAVYTTTQKYQTINSVNVHFEDMMDHLGDVLTILVTLDRLVGSLDHTTEGLSLYKRLIQTVQLNISPEKLTMFETVIKDLESNLFSGKIFHNVLDKLTEIGPSIRESKLNDELQLYLRNMLSKLESKELNINQMINQEEMLWMKVNCLFILNAHLFGLHDKKMLKQIWDVSKKYVCVNLFKNVILFPDDFLCLHLPHIMRSDDKKQKQAVASIRLEMLNQRNANLANDIQKLTQETCLWVIQFNTILSQEKSVGLLDDLREKGKLILSGVRLASNISRVLKTILNLHAALSKPMTKAVVLQLCKMAELLKGIESVYQHHYFLVAASINHIGQYLAYQVLNVIKNAKNRILADKSYTKKHLDTLSALVLTERILLGPMTVERCLIARLALSIARGNTSKALKDDEVEHIYSNLQHLNKLCLIQKSVTESCDTSFLYFQRAILPVYFKNVVKSKMPRLKLSYMLNCLSDSMDFLPKEHDSVKSFEKDVLSKVRTDAVLPLCENIETNLRLQVHSHLRQDKTTNNPLLSGDESHNLTGAVELGPMKLFSRYIDLKSYVELYLDKTFYNLTTVALHDWKSYGEMRNLGKIKYNLNFVRNHLPYQTLEHGLDVLEIMRNIHIFVSKYQYNLNNQIFIEHSSQNKHLNTINIRHVSNSIRMHGTGIMNTTVNFTYQFLCQKFYIFSEFLFDELIKSKLTKDIVYFKERKAQSEQKYSYERADSFNRAIRKMGLTPDGLSYLDHFRILISQIGNALGYVRMIRSGGMHWCSDSLNFIPDLEEIFGYGEACRGEGFTETTCEAADRLDHVVRDLTQNFAEGTQYFKLLVEVFANDFRNPKKSHLQNFYIIVPPLTINFVEYMITAKDKMNRRNKSGATFTDDGFAMGVAFVLKLLNQNKQFDSLHWFQSVREKYNRERTPLEKSGPVDENLRTTNLLTAKRLDAYLQEFDLLYFNLSSAKIFFQKQVSGE